MSRKTIIIATKVVDDTIMTYWNGLSRITYTVSALIIALSLILSLHISSSSPALQPSISVPSLRAELVLDGLSSPTSIAF